MVCLDKGEGSVIVSKFEESGGVGYPNNAILWSIVSWVSRVIER